ncbi:phage head closure protein [Arsenophonus nasoniae]|uniref:Phage head closure protein n=1 Tax=Arsenophonus nasoniae TaxID=638 RepID=A0ABY8NZ85_9GAMM|nr:phage head closure protein [Arsenophonus nasoniae]WGM09161.1 phage head closure protein [Arsenophonus nasoniae]
MLIKRLTKSQKFPKTSELNKLVLFHKRRDKPRGDISVEADNKNSKHVWAKIVQVSDFWKLTATQLNKDITHQIITRYRGDLYVCTEAICDGVTYSIRGVLDIGGAERFLSFSCKEIKENKEEKKKVYGYQ